MNKYLRMVPYQIKSAFKSFWRHIAMSLSAASAVSVTLLLMMCFLLLAGNLSGFTTNIEDEIQIHVTIDPTNDQAGIDAIEAQILEIDHISNIEFSSKEAELDLFIASFGESGEMFEIYRGDSNPMRDAFIIDINDKQYLNDVGAKIKNIEGVESAEFGGDSTVEMIKALDSVRIAGFFFVVSLSILAMFLISNTIKITIHARANEIAIMRNVGASNSFIRMPFLIEGVLIGLVGAIVPVLVTVVGYGIFYNELGGVFFTEMFKLQPTTPFAFEIAGILCLSGISVGLIGSFVSVGKYLKWKR